MGRDRVEERAVAELEPGGGHGWRLRPASRARERPRREREQGTSEEPCARMPPLKPGAAGRAAGTAAEASVGGLGASSAMCTPWDSHFVTFLLNIAPVTIRKFHHG